MEGTGQWLLRRSDLLQWLNDLGDQDSSVIWLIGLPASGKTALSSVVVNQLRSQFASCQHHFFTTGHQTKRTAAYCLRSIASQLAQANLEFREALYAFHAETGIKFTSQDQNFNTIWEKVYEGIILKMRFRKPLFWVLDGVDEADLQSQITSCLLSMRPATTIKIFLSSRPMKIPAVSAGKEGCVTPILLSDGDTEKDIRAYVTTAIHNILSADEVVQHDLIDQILAKASGSFLWVRLSLESLSHNWHTQEDIRKALNELPPGMLALYEEMITRLLSQPPRTELLARRILTWVTCSWRPLKIEELETALESEFGRFLNFEDTLNQICGHFLSIDNGRISLIHATARQFLTSERASQPAFIQPREAHSQMSVRCLVYLSQDFWSRIFRAVSLSVTDDHGYIRKNRLLLAEQGSPLLGYATCYWAYHVSKSSTSSRELTGALTKFFSQHCLSWIEGIALSSNLRYLTRSARYLKTYAKRKKHSRTHSDSSPILESLTELPEDDPKWLHAWATDLIRIVGKFGPILLTKPSSIHLDIIPFCPKNSIISLTHGERRPEQLSVTGLPSDSWDDRLASVSVGDDRIASQVLATESYFITLVSSIGSIAVWHAETCEQARKIEVGEYVPVMALSRAGTLLATATLNSYSVWELSSGRLVSHIRRLITTRTITLSFAQDDAYLLVGCDDCSITIYDRFTSTEVSNHNFEPPSDDYQGCPTAMAINPGCNAVAMAWRGKVPLVWHFQSTTYQPIRTRRLRQSIASISAPEALRWQMDGNSLFILCQDTNLVEWRLYDDQQLAYPHLKAREFAISSDGNLVLTSDHTGTVSVWTFPRLSLVYQLGSENDFVRDVEFSPDGQRLYDVRDSLCNVWEPDVLIRPDEQDLEDQSSLDEFSIVSSEPTIAQIDNTQGVITAIATSDSDVYFCCGRDDGTVIIHEATNGKAIRKVYSHSSTTSVLLISWSPSGRYMVTSDDSARVIGKRLKVKAKDEWAVFPVFDARVSEPVQQFLFSQDEQWLLISTSSTDQVFDLRIKKQVWYEHWGTRQSRRWVQNTVDPASLLWIEPQVMRSYHWTTMSFQANIEVESDSNAESELAPGERSHRPSDRLVVWAACIKSSGLILYGTLPIGPSQGTISCLSHSGLHLEIVQPSLEPSSQATSPSLACSPNLAGRVKRLLGVTKDKIAYLDHDNQLCTWDLDNGLDSMREHFFLPRDWLNVSSLELALIHETGTFFCPKGGYVAIVRNGLLD
jgi:WD40 repeat protein